MLSFSKNFEKRCVILLKQINKQTNQKTPQNGNKKLQANFQDDVVIFSEGPFCLGYVFFCFVLFFVFGLFAFSRAVPVADGGSQAGGRIGAVAVGLCQSHSNAGSEPHLQPTPQLTARLDP